MFCSSPFLRHLVVQLGELTGRQIQVKINARPRHSGKAYGGLA
jgi:hypothetical protein